MFTYIKRYLNYVGTNPDKEQSVYVHHVLPNRPKFASINLLVYFEIIIIIIIIVTLIMKIIGLHIATNLFKFLHTFLLR